MVRFSLPYQVQFRTHTNEPLRLARMIAVHDFSQRQLIEKLLATATLELSMGLCSGPLLDNGG